MAGWSNGWVEILLGRLEELKLSRANEVNATAYCDTQNLYYKGLLHYHWSFTIFLFFFSFKSRERVLKVLPFSPSFARTDYSKIYKRNQSNKKRV